MYYLGEGKGSVVHDRACVVRCSQVVDLVEVVLHEVVAHVPHDVVPHDLHVLVPISSGLLVPETCRVKGLFINDVT